MLFGQHPDQWRKVLDDPASIGQAIEEILRYLPPSQYQGRFSVEDRTYEGGTIPAGHPVLLITGAATRDPRAFDRPDDFDIFRPNPRILAFGHGAHVCLGAAVARLEARIASYEMAARLQLSAPEVLELSSESAATRALAFLSGTVNPNGLEICAAIGAWASGAVWIASVSL